jgi:hypothetical protein
MSHERRWSRAATGATTGTVAPLRHGASWRVEAERSDDAEIDQHVSDVVPGIGPDGDRFFTTLSRERSRPSYRQRLSV